MRVFRLKPRFVIITSIQLLSNQEPGNQRSTTQESIYNPRIDTGYWGSNFVDGAPPGFDHGKGCARSAGGL